MNIELHWIDQNDEKYNITLDDGFGPTAHGLGPYDLSENVFWTGKIKKVWLEFGGCTYTSPVSVRIGWVKLTE